MQSELVTAPIANCAAGGGILENFDRPTVKEMTGRYQYYLSTDGK
jgi:hypothetical protein